FLCCSPRMTLRMQEKRYTSSIILHFGPRRKSEVEKNEKIRNVGHCTVYQVHKNYKTFCQTKPFFFEVEDSFWIIMVSWCSSSFTHIINQSFVNRVEESLSLIKCSAFLYNVQLIWSGLEQDDMRILYKYLTTSLFPRHSEPELAGRDSPLRPEVARNLLHNGRRVLKHPLWSPASLPPGLLKKPKVPKSILLILTVWSYSLPVSVELTREFCEQLDGLVGPQLTLLASDLCEQYNVNHRTSGPDKEPQFKFIYFNNMNLAEKSTIHMRKTPSVFLTSVHPDMKILGDINWDFAQVDEEIIVKAMTDYWVVSQKSDQRELCVILNKKNVNLFEVNEEVKRLCATQFNNIFFLD
uniref:CCZ1 homolog, vacuolar protein trafficking and biogenesis associated n=1 Tax=Salmo trutta TaxID=8032 RepID=A0A673WE52_SALTR